MADTSCTRSTPLHLCTSRPYYFLVPIPYEKSYLTIPEQLDLLRERGMGISDEQQAEMWLRRVGYYRLSGYWYPFRERESSVGTNGDETVNVLDTFRPETNLSHAFNLYVFDKRLRVAPRQSAS